MSRRPVVIASNRGPASFEVDDDGSVVTRRGGGGLASGLRSLTDEPGTVWISAAMSDGDRAAIGSPDAAEAGVRLLDIAPDDYRAYYDTISNETLWFAHHHLWDLTRDPAFDEEWRAAWRCYERVNDMFADAIAEVAPEDAVVLVQDYHLSLVGRRLRSVRPDIVSVHFHHTPFAEPAFIRALPREHSRELLEALAAFSSCGFHTARWSSDFEASCASLGITAPPTFVAPLGIDVESLSATAASARVASEVRDLDAVVGDRILIARVDRIELSKNLSRGFLAFDELLNRYPQWRGAVMFGAFCYPSRAHVEAYARYRAEVIELVEAINLKWAAGDWIPIVLETEDDFDRSVAALTRYDVLVVNPIRDGLNLVAKEGPAVNRRHGALVLSSEAGAAAELGECSLLVNPFDVSELADRLHEALSLDASERTDRAVRLRAAAVARTAEHWLDDQLASIGIDSAS